MLRSSSSSSLQTRAHNVEMANVYSATTCDTIFTLLLFVVTVWLLTNQRVSSWSNPVKTSIALLWLSYLFFETRNLIMVCEHLTYHEFYDVSEWFKCLELFGISLLIIQHWHLTSQYMKTSCLLRLAFSSRSVSAIVKAQKRKSMLRYADYSFYAFVLIIVVTAICI